jgi:SAM-dependent methyltransferase
MTGKTAIERLSFDAAQPHEAIEAAIHLNRYLLARGLCAGKRVLDAACGEGYGSQFMVERWGASSVDGVDVSEDAITRATQLFAGDRVRFHCRRAEDLDEIFAPGQFDVAISLETIEHLNDPAAFLRSLRRVVVPGGAIVVSCPNDHWYYPTPEQRNPFHVRKYTFDEFRALVERELGPECRYMVGVPAAGFATVPFERRWMGGNGDAARAEMFEAREEVRALLVPADDRIGWENCSYFVALWGCGAERALTAAVYPLSMDKSTTIAPIAQIEALRLENSALRTALEEAQRAHRRAQLRAEAASRELAMVRQRLVPHSCYETLERKVTGRLPAPFGKVVSWTGSRVRGAARRLLSP